MDAVRYNGRVGSIASNRFQWVRPEWCPKHGEGAVEGEPAKCWCTRAVGTGADEVDPQLALDYVRSGSFDAVDLDLEAEAEDADHAED